MADLAELGFDSLFAEQFSLLPEHDNLLPARVCADSGDLFELVGCPARHGVLAGRLRYQAAGQQRPTTGDWVTVERDSEPAVITHVLERKTALVRRAAGSDRRAQIVAANVDVYFIVTSANLEFNPRRIERYLTAIWDSGAQPVLVLNKIDLLSDPAALVSQAEQVCGGAPVLPVSALTGQGMAALSAHLRAGQTFGFVGSSGVGKSSLINALCGRDIQTTARIGVDDKGDHTTTRRELVALPGRGVLVDTPGMRELGILLAGTGLDQTFSDVVQVAAGCRYRDCRHQGEPGCAVALAVDDGELSAERVASYLKLQREAAAAEARQSPQLAANTKRRWKAIHKRRRAYGKLRGGSD